MPDNPNYLVKIINVEVVGDEEHYPPEWRHPATNVNRQHKIQANEWETNLELQQKYPGVFPRSYEAGADFSWVLVERLEPVTWSIVQQMLGLDGIVDIEAIPPLIGQAVDFMNSTYVERISHWAQKDLQEAEAETMMSYLGSEEDPEATPVRPQVPTKTRPGPLSMATWSGRDLFALKSILSVPHNRRLFLAAAEMDIPPKEIAPKNLGVSTIGAPRLVLLDSSILFVDPPQERGKF